MAGLDTVTQGGHGRGTSIHGRHLRPFGPFPKLLSMWTRKLAQRGSKICGRYADGGPVGGPLRTVHWPLEWSAF